MDRNTFKKDMASAWSRVGYGRLKNKMAEFDQTGYGTPVEKNEDAIINPETITGEYEAAPANEWLDEDIPVQFPGTKREQLYAIQESKRAAKVQVDQKFVMIAWLVAVGIAFVSSAIVSFNGITAVAQFVGLAAPWMASLFFFFIELMYLIFLVAYLVLASRVDDDGKPERTGGALWGMISFAAIAVGANAFHTLDYWQWDITNPQVWAGIVLSVAAPIAIISASKMASRVVFAKAIRL